MPEQVFVVGLVLAVGILMGRLLAGRLGVPEAAAYVIVGIAAGFVPGMSEVRLAPEVILLVFLPPLLHYAGFFSDPRETVRHIVPVVGQSVVLVLLSASVIAGALLLVFPDIGWAAALAFGAAVAPPDPVAATGVLQRLGAPRRLITVLEGEGLINDAVALTIFALAVAGVGATTTVLDVGAELALQVGGGIALGLLVGIGATWVRKRIRDVPSLVVLSLATPFLAFVPAHLVHSSGVLATVTAAVWLGSRSRGHAEPRSRLHTETFWRVLNVMLVALLFVLLGVQVPGIVIGLGGYPVGDVALATVAVVVAAVAVRLGWVLLVAPLAARLPGREGSTAVLSLKERLALGWCGPRGAVSLAVALSLPLTTAAGVPFPRRDLLLFLTIVVVLVTLVGQVVTLPAVFRLLKLAPDEDERTEGLRARSAAVDAALRELDTAADEHDPEPGVEGQRQLLEIRRDRLRSRLRAETDASVHGEPSVDRDVRLRLRLLDIQRRTVVTMHDRGQLSRTAMVEISQELDLDETQLRAKE